MSKFCTGCYRTLSFDLFSNNISSKDGYRSRCKNCDKKYYEENKDKIIQHHKQYCEVNRERIRKYKSDYNYNRYLTDPKFRIQKSIRKSFHRIWKSKPSGSIDLIQCSWEQLYSWLELSLPRGYTMDDIGTKLNIDHVIPLSKFKLEDLHLAYRWDNLQLLTKIEE